MQRFMILIQGGFAKPDQIGPEQMEAHLRKWHAWTQYLIENGHYVAGDALKSEGARLAGPPDQLIVTSGPFPESQELLGGFYVLQAKDLAAVTELCKQSPNFEFGGAVEVRPFVAFAAENAKAFL
jgi:hypothetical protein